MRVTVLMMTMMAAMKTTNGMMVPGPSMIMVSFGTVGTWGVNSTNSPFYRVGTYGSVITKGKEWIQVVPPTSGLKQLSVGSNIVWAIAKNDRIFYRAGIDKKHPSGTKWNRIPGGLMQISVSQRGHVWGVNRNKHVYIRTGVTAARPQGKGWKGIAGQKLKYVSAGVMGVWALDVHNNVFCRDNTYGGCDAVGTGWTHVHGIKMTHIASATDTVYGISEGRLYKRMGIGMDNPMGTAWTPIMMESDPMGMVDSVQDVMWTAGVGPSGTVHFKYMKGCCC